jgi:hypothetical protein
MTVQASEVRELIEEVRGSYGYDVDTGERVDLEYGIPEQYEPIAKRMEDGGEMTFEEEFWFVEAYSFFCRKHHRFDEFFDLLHKAEVRLIESCQLQAYWDGDGDCYMVFPKAAECFTKAFPKAVRIMPTGTGVAVPDAKRLAVAMEWALERAKRHREHDAEEEYWEHAPDIVHWKTTTGKHLVRRYESVD